MLMDLSDLPDDHVVPGDVLAGFYTSPVHSPGFEAASLEKSVRPLKINANANCGQQRALPDLWKDIEEILNEEKPFPSVQPCSTLQHQNHPTPSVSPVPDSLAAVTIASDQDKSRNPRKLARLSLTTPDFSALIGAERLVGVDTPAAVPTSPGFHEVPRVTFPQHSPAPGIRVTETSSLPPSTENSLMETSMLINNTIASGCECMQYANTVPASPVDISRAYNSAPTDLQRTCMDLEFDPEGFIPTGHTGGVLEDMKERLKYACTVMDIPIDPNTWTVEHVQKWAMFILKQYDRALESDLFLRLSINGATLTTMTKEDFMTYFPNVGEMLYNEMEIWCFAFSCGHVMTTPLSNPVMPQSMQQEVTYTDLDSFKTFTYDMSNTSSLASLPHLTSAPPCLIPSPPAMGSSMCSMPSNQICIKQEPCDMERSGVLSPGSSAISPASSPESALGAGRIPSYSSSSSSCGYNSSEDPYEAERELKRHVISSRGKHTIQLWQFLKELLLQPQCYETYIRWLDRGKGIFKIEDSAQVAKLWGRRKNRPAMNYDKLSRSIRQYYKKGIIKKTGQSKRLVYQFCPQYNG